MTTYNPPSFPHRPKHRNIFTEIKYQIHLAYYRYEINTALYVMSPGEKTAFNILFLSLIILLASGIYYYLPRATVFGLHRLAYYLTGTHKLVAAPGPDVSQGFLQRTVAGEAVATLGGQAMRVVNASGTLVG
ncbi:uncharacterized protein MYCFIDRAFT_212647 [Pseudocercospora fijiensis CIRAD86]|uniref:Uncharacterized protein n=1 Tax=Pseudocercospora fijiensis (strain CIRAD86) TaxID=383855 RepID=M2YK62_PSEFD|nr:uncharacterized protein MYCFIDRAFT_212647 [Pseudocercospora fijiensis CIRAD86]EME78150.1 hypothetical protein MYCFIDRAFT_212647 [Pseudocercospora fijiensis CIRAD86]